MVRIYVMRGIFAINLRTGSARGAMNCSCHAPRRLFHGGNFLTLELGALNF